MEKLCPRCGVNFACSHDPITDCHCAWAWQHAAQRAYITGKYDDCLCNGCRRLIKEAFYCVLIDPLYPCHIESQKII